MSEPNHNRGKSEQSVQTDPLFIEAFVRRFGPITFDLCADNLNAQAPQFFSKYDDGLCQDWTKLNGNLWCNPPFEDVSPWCEKARIEMVPDHLLDQLAAGLFRKRSNAFLLIPVATGTLNFRTNVFGHCRIHFLGQRLKFVGHKHPFPKDLMLCQYGASPGCEIWNWKPKKPKTKKDQTP